MSIVVHGYGTLSESVVSAPPSESRTDWLESLEAVCYEYKSNYTATISSAYAMFDVTKKAAPYLGRQSGSTQSDR